MFSPMIDLLVRAAILLIAAWLTAAVARRRSASFRALIWTGALGSLLILPVLSRMLPSWPIEAWRVRRLEAAAVPRDDACGATCAGRDDSRARAHGHNRRTEIGRLPASPSGSTALMPATSATAISWGAVGLWLWVLVTVALCSPASASGYARLANVLRQSDATSMPDPAWLVLLAAARSTSRHPPSVAILVTGDVSVPSVAGVWKPVLLLPPDADEWTPDVRHAVVFHELAHVARWDALAQLLSQIACRLYWFLPLAWIGARRAASLRERACDDAVLRAGVGPTTYADSLIQLASDGGASWRPAALAMASPSRLRERIVAILDPVTRRDAVGRLDRRPSS